MHNITIFLESALFIYSSFLTGIFLIRALEVDLSRLQKIVYAVLLGYGFWGIIGFLLGIAGLFDAALLRLIFSLIIILSFNTIHSHIIFLRDFSMLKTAKAFFKEYTVLKSLIILWLVLTLLITFMPITGFDTLKYHLPIIQDILTTESLTFSADIYNYAYLPVLAEIIYAVPSAIFNNTTDPYIFQIVQTSAFFLFLLLIYGFAKDTVKHSFLPIVLVLAAMSIMDLQREVLLGGHIDTMMLVAAFSSMFILLVGIDKGKIKRGNMVVSALLLAFAVSMKYFALFFVGSNGLLLTYFYLRHKTKVKTAIISFLKYFSVSAIVAGFWYVKNLFIFGDPVYPIFKGVEFDAGGWWVAERTISNMFIFPYLKWGRWFFDETESSSTLVVLSYFIAVYALILFFVIIRRRFTFFEIVLFASSHLYLWILFFNSHHERYLLGSTLLLPILIVLLLDKLLIYLKECHSLAFYRGAVKTITICAAVVFFVAFAGSIHFFQYKYWYLLGVHDKQEYIVNIGGL